MLHFQSPLSSVSTAPGKRAPHQAAGHCQAEPDSVQQLHVQQPFTYAKPEAASAVLGS